MRLAIREMGPEDLDLWAELAAALWPEDAIAVHGAAIARTHGLGGRRGFVAEADGVVAGFAELGLRPYANGCERRPVAFLEGIWVAPRFRRQGVRPRPGRPSRGAGARRGPRRARLGRADRQRGLARAHRAWGFEEIERVVCFRKAL